MMRMMAILAAMLLTMSVAVAQDSLPESYYQDMWCGERGGVIEHVLPDRARIDCLLDWYAVEVDFQYKWAESIWQALYYANMTHRSPAVLLIVDHNAARYLTRFRNAADGLGIKLFVIEK